MMVKQMNASVAFSTVECMATDAGFTDSAEIFVFFHIELLF